MSATEQTPRKKRKMEKSGSDRKGTPHGLLTPEPRTLAQKQPGEGGFPLLKLPAELRLHIYRWTLCRDEPLLLDLLCLPSSAAEDKDDGEVDNDETHDSATSLDDAAHERSDRPRRAMDTPSINVALLHTCSLIYKEARPIFYAENDFTLSLEWGVQTLAQLHQRSRSYIKSILLVIPTWGDILGAFPDMVRLGLRYCWGLKTLTLRFNDMFPGFDISHCFFILRWLPKGCRVVL